MTKLSRLSSTPAASLLAIALAGCAVSAAPASSSEPATEAQSAAPRLEQAASRLCFPPITPMTGAWSCGGSGVRTGDKMATTTSGYTNNCTGRATVEFSIPSCGVVSPWTQYDEISVRAVGISALSSTACAASYLDYTIWGLGSATDVWSVGESGRAYGVYLNGQCDLHAPTYYPVSAAWTQFEISADAYESLYFPLPGGGLVPIGTAPVNVAFDASFVQ